MKEIIIYCDGGCRGNQNKENIGGWGAILEYNGNTKEIKGNCINTTNNKMELTGIIESLKAIKNKQIITKVYCDSQYVVTGINQWVNGWVAKNWRKSDKKLVENKELWQELLYLKNQFTDIQILKCKGHSDNVGNNKADELVNLAMDELEV